VSLSDLPLASGQRHRKVLEQRFGFVCRRDAERIVLASPSGVIVSIPNHHEVKRPTLKQAPRTARIDDREYRRAFDTV
jgi:hypothetical protein